MSGNRKSSPRARGSLGAGVSPAAHPLIGDAIGGENVARLRLFIRNMNVEGGRQ
jgi:hypothetical protein